MPQGITFSLSESLFPELEIKIIGFYLGQIIFPKPFYYNIGNKYDKMTFLI